MVHRGRALYGGAPPSTRPRGVHDFDEFWEFVSGSLNAGPHGPNPLDGTFGPAAVFVHAPLEQNNPPLDAYQQFGEARIGG
ncbi:hypothetical protein AB0B25_30400 [Nocardia sp. NPDC049190]|uniref:hypothetical protein n=1 Tax=Nocardia sp. NPDC049190 TaxID=3155650 RepID=UPI0033C681B0